MTQNMRIDFVSDVSCPWCAIGLKSLQQALERVGAEVSAEIHFQPFELVPDMAPEGEKVTDHLARKYGSTQEQMAQARDNIRRRGADVGFMFDLEKRTKLYNTFDAHRLLAWADTRGRQLALKEKLFEAYFIRGQNPSDHAQLVQLAGEAGLDADGARAVLDGGAFADEVREREAYWQRAGVSAVPSVIINERHLISGGQPAEVFEQALRQIARQDEDLEQDEEPAA